MEFDYKDVKKGTEHKMGGTRNFFLVAARRTITNSALLPPTSGSAVGDLAKFAGPITFGTDDGFVKIYNTLNLGDFTGDNVGRRDTRAKKLIAKGTHPGHRAEALEFDRMAQREDWVVLVPTNNGQYLMMGFDGLESEYSSVVKTGTIENGENGIEMTWEAYSEAVFVYTGTVTLKPVESGE
jgi:hypothetical protein